uniref:Reverse transcriptase Ty1/copia-type domain-containing protein n=1 Tax=Strigamia maritima TaxID=126957 RepID=T1IQJ9_STRMM
MKLTRDLELVGKKISDDDVTYQMTCTLPPQYHNIVSIMHRWEDVEFISSKVEAMLIEEFENLKARSAHPNGSGIKVLGHYSASCRKRKPNTSGGGGSVSYFVPLDAEALIIDVMSVPSVTNKWIWDTGSGTHLCYNKNLFSQLSMGKPYQMNAYSGTFNVEGEGTVEFTHLVNNAQHEGKLRDEGQVKSGGNWEQVVKQRPATGRHPNRYDATLSYQGQSFRSAKAVIKYCDENDIDYSTKSIKKSFQYSNPYVGTWDIQDVGDEGSAEDSSDLDSPDFNLKVNCYVDASWATTIPDRKSVTGYLITIGNNLILWRTTKQGLVTMSAMEAKLIALSELVKEIIWFKHCLDEVINVQGLDFGKITVNCDNQAGMHFIRNDVENLKTKYMDVKLQFVKEHYKNNLFNLQYIYTKKNLADMLTKCVNKEKLFFFINIMLNIYVHSHRLLILYSTSDVNFSDSRVFPNKFKDLLGGAVVSWGCGKQSSIATSIMEAEFVALVNAVREDYWIGSIFQNLNVCGT